MPSTSLNELSTDICVEVNEMTPLFQYVGYVLPERLRDSAKLYAQDPRCFVCDNACRDVYIYNLSTLLTFKKENRNKM